MLLFMFMMVFFFGLMCIMVNNVLIWWSVFLMMTLLFVMLNKMNMSFNSLFNYFVLQESLGLLFLLLMGNLQLMMLFLKVGVAPLHFWIFSVTNSVFGFNLMWFLTFQKLPFLFVIMQIVNVKFLFFLFVGLLLCLLQMLLIKSFKNLLILSSTESFNWILLSYVFSVLNVMIIFLYYFFMMMILIPKFTINFNEFVDWETVLVFLNLPFSVNFFVKIFALVNIVNWMNLWILFLLFLMFMSMISLSFWLVNLSVKNLNSNKYSKLYYMFLPLMMIVLI
uniref:NADH dehydrogenase subunit 2 n=1 Tax=Cooperia oncophora TaxID=27828 RepID=A0A4P2SCI4_COOON|nr:NADH dehydrogenase subunit 2 [Cooperia oncophora]